MDFMVYQMSVESSGPTVVQLGREGSRGSGPGSRGAKGANVPLFIYAALGIGKVARGCAVTHMEISHSFRHRLQLPHRCSDFRTWKETTRDCVLQPMSSDIFLPASVSNELEYPRHALWHLSLNFWCNCLNVPPFIQYVYYMQFKSSSS